MAKGLVSMRFDTVHPTIKLDTVNSLGTKESVRPNATGA